VLYDVIVVGVGGMGSAVVCHLARRGLKVLGLEQFDIPHEMGSSHGISRIIRLAYWEHPGYVPLLRRAYQLWHELEKEVDERLLFITGGIDAGEEASDTVKGALLSCKIHDLPHEQLDAAALSRRFPGYRLASGLVAMYQPDAGFLLPERCIVAHVMAAQRLGAVVHARERVTTDLDNLEILFRDSERMRMLDHITGIPNFECWHRVVSQKEQSLPTCRSSSLLSSN